MTHNDQLLNRTQLKVNQLNSNTQTDIHPDLQTTTMTVTIVGYANVNTFSVQANELQKDPILVVEVTAVEDTTMKSMIGTCLAVSHKLTGKFNGGKGATFEVSDFVITSSESGGNQSEDTIYFHKFLEGIVKEPMSAKVLGLKEWFGKVKGMIMTVGKVKNLSAEVKSDPKLEGHWKQFHGIQAKYLPTAKPESDIK